jgi:hypothetical protein
MQLRVAAEGLLGASVEEQLHDLGAVVGEEVGRGDHAARAAELQARHDGVHRAGEDREVVAAAGRQHVRRQLVRRGVLDARDVGVVGELRDDGGRDDDPVRVGRRDVEQHRDRAAVRHLRVVGEEDVAGHLLGEVVGRQDGDVVDRAGVLGDAVDEVDGGARRLAPDSDDECLVPVCPCRQGDHRTGLVVVQRAELAVGAEHHDPAHGGPAPLFEVVLEPVEAKVVGLVERRDRRNDDPTELVVHQLVPSFRARSIRALSSRRPPADSDR